jgi:hypothetical protein
VEGARPFFFYQDYSTYLAMKVLDGQGRNSHAVVLTPGFKNFLTAPALVSSAFLLNSTLYAVKDALIGPGPRDLSLMFSRNGTTEPKAGDLILTETHSILIVATEKSTDFIDLKTGRSKPGTRRNFQALKM